MRLFFFLILLITSANLSFAQCIQKGPYYLFSAKQFFDFIGDVSSGEDELLSNNFCFQETNEIEHYTYHTYRINHSANYDTNRYAYDSFSIVNDLARVEYNTTSSENYISYKNKLIDYGFGQISDDLYQIMSVDAVIYYMLTSRYTNESSGTPIYKITVFSL